MRSFEDVRAHLGARFALTASEPYQIAFDIDIDEERRQGLFLGDLETEGGRRYLRISTPIAPLSSSALAFSSSLAGPPVPAASRM